MTRPLCPWLPCCVLVAATATAAQEFRHAESEGHEVAIGGRITPEAVELVLSRQTAGLYDPPEMRHRPLHTIPIVFHIVRDSLGRISHPSGYRLDERIPGAMGRLNEHFAASGMQFCQVGPPLYIDSDFWADWQPGATFDELLQIGRVEDAVNVYLFPKPTIIGGVIAFTWSPVQSIGINFHSFNDDPHDNAALTRMVSHYFDLFLTDEDRFGIECASGSNCDVAGDLVCDTPPETLHLVTTYPECEWVRPPPYQGQCPGDPMYTPDKHNIMGNRRRSCLFHLTQGQQDRAYATLVNIRHEIDLMMCGCPADCDLSGMLDINDYLCFLDAFVTEEPYACNMDTSTGALTCDVFDLLAFQDAFVGGCG